jgi:hypothetical protein
MFTFSKRSKLIRILTCFNEEVGLDIFLHLFHRRNKMVVPPVHLPTRIYICNLFSQKLPYLNLFQKNPQY